MFTRLLSALREYIQLTPEEENLLVSKLEVRRVKKRQWLVTPGEYCKNDYFINKGCFRSYCIDEDGHEHITKLAMEGWWITDLKSFITGEPAVRYVEALEDGEVIVWRKHVLEELYEQIPQLNKYFRILYQKALVNNHDRIFRTISGTAEEHYYKFVAQYPELEQRIPQYMIASYLGITPEFLSRIKSKRISAIKLKPHQ